MNMFIHNDEKEILLFLKRHKALCSKELKHVVWSCDLPKNRILIKHFSLPTVDLKILFVHENSVLFKLNNEFYVRTFNDQGYQDKKYEIDGDGLFYLYLNSSFILYTTFEPTFKGFCMVNLVFPNNQGKIDILGSFFGDYRLQVFGNTILIYTTDYNQIEFIKTVIDPIKKRVIKTYKENHTVNNKNLQIEMGFGIVAFIDNSIEGYTMLRIFDMINFTLKSTILDLRYKLTKLSLTYDALWIKDDYETHILCLPSHLK